MPEPLEILRTVFGYDAFRGEQAAVVERVCAGGDAVVLMPTGGGKSLCYQIPAIVRPGVGVVISPLIALMQDQVAALRQAGVRAATLNSATPAAERREAVEAMRRGELDLVYVSPERMLTSEFMDFLDDVPVALFAIDEAHCVSQWGHDFRPEYRGLDVLARRWPGVPRIALTATADTPTRADIAERLALQDAAMFVASFDRPNIRYAATPRAQGRKQLLDFIDAGHRGESGIVYVQSRAGVERIAEWLAEQGLTALPYHAGLDAAERARNQDRFVREDGVVMVATIAFGMGIDKPDVRFVAHMNMPKSVEAYYQETGRAGRDGLPSEALMLYGMDDAATARSFIAKSEAPEEQKRIEHQKLDALLGYCETTRCRREVLLGYFGESYAGPCGNCDTCLNPVETYDGTETAQKLLSCIYRTGQRFGAGHVIDVLRGAENERVAKFGHARLSTYGIGADLPAKEWRSIVRQLVSLGLIEVDVEGYGALKLTDACRPVLRGERRVDLRHDPAPRRRRARDGAAQTPAAVPHGEPLFEALRAKRLELARQQGVPPYVVFHDRTLAAMAERKPRSVDEFALLPGVGASKCQRYASPFLEVLSAHA